MTEKEWERKHASEILEGLSNKVSENLWPPTSLEYKNYMNRNGFKTTLETPHNESGVLRKFPRIVERWIENDSYGCTTIQAFRLSDGRIIKEKADHMNAKFAGTYAGTPYYQSENEHVPEAGWTTKLPKSFEQELRDEVDGWCRGALKC